MIILGIDPGTICTGYGIICLENNSLRKVASGVIRPSSTKTLPLKLEIIYEQLCSLISQTFT